MDFSVAVSGEILCSSSNGSLLTVSQNLPLIKHHSLEGDVCSLATVGSSLLVEDRATLLENAALVGTMNPSKSIGLFLMKIPCMLHASKDWIEQRHNTLIYWNFHAIKYPLLLPFQHDFSSDFLQFSEMLIFIQLTCLC